MSLILKTPDLTVFGANGFAIGKSGSPGSIEFDTNLPGAMPTLNDGFYASAFFYLPSGVSTGLLKFIQTQYVNHTSIFRGMSWATTINGSDTRFQIIFRNDSSNRRFFEVDVPTSSITADKWHHILIAHSGSSGYGTKAYFNDSAISSGSISDTEIGTVSSLTVTITDNCGIGGSYTVSGTPTLTGDPNGIAYQNIYFSRYGSDDPDTASNRRKFLNADGTPATGTPILPAVGSAEDGDPNMFVSGTHNTVDNFENPADANTPNTYTITRTNIFPGPSDLIDVI
jgi:hypothetical protein